MCICHIAIADSSLFFFNMHPHSNAGINGFASVKATGPDSPAGGAGGAVGFINGDHNTITQEGVQVSVETTGPRNPAGGAAGSIKGDHNTITQKDVHSTVKTNGTDSPAGGAAGFIKGDHNTITQKGGQFQVSTGVKTGNSHGNDYSGGDRDDNGNDGGH